MTVTSASAKAIIESNTRSYFRDHFNINLAKMDTTTRLAFAGDNILISYDNFSDFSDGEKFMVAITFCPVNPLHFNLGTQTKGRNDLIFAPAPTRNFVNSIKTSAVSVWSTLPNELDHIIKSSNTYQVSYHRLMSDPNVFRSIYSVHKYNLTSMFAALLELDEVVNRVVSPVTVTVTTTTTTKVENEESIAEKNGDTLPGFAVSNSPYDTLDLDEYSSYGF